MLRKIWLRPPRWLRSRFRETCHALHRCRELGEQAEAKAEREPPELSGLVEVQNIRDVIPFPRYPGAVLDSPCAVQPTAPCAPEVMLLSE